MSECQRTTDGKVIEEGLRVFTCECVWGTVVEHLYHQWWRIRYDDGSYGTYDGSRMSTQDLVR